jgi:Uncharacterized protein conserved in bacteria
VELSPEAVRRFAALFSGYQKAYGTFLIRGTAADGKAIGKAQTLRGQATDKVYQAHLDGAGGGLGVIMLREDNTVYFGAIDYDNKTMDHVKAEARVRELGLPLVLCRSKSGGGHFYCFTSEPVPAVTMRDRLEEWTAMLGMSDTTEQFPKQAERYNESDIGNWINLPYFNAQATNRFAIRDGREIGLLEFLDYAESLRQTAEQMGHVSGPSNDETIFFEGPPCLQMIESKGGFVQGTKKEGMFSATVYLRKRYPDDWQKRVDAVNQKMAGLLSTEVTDLIKQVNKKQYSYKCTVPPINSCCNRRVCRTRMYGVGETDSVDARGFAIGALTRYETSNGDEPLFAMEVAGKRVLVTTAQLYSRDEFNRACISQANVIPVHMTPVRWLKFLNDILPTADIVPLPEDASPLGQLWEHIVMFLTQTVTATELSKITLGVPYRDMGDNMIYFRSMDMFNYLNARRIPYKSPQMVWELLKRKGGEKKFVNLGGRGTNVWYIPAPAEDEVRVAEANTQASSESMEAF